MVADTTERYDLEEAFGKFGRVKNSWVARYTSSSKMFETSNLARHKLVVVVPSLSSASLYFLTTTQLDFTHFRTLDTTLNLTSELHL